MHISFECDNCQLIYRNGAVFNITQRGCLYYLINIISARNATYDLHTWHKILGQCNESDIKKLPNLVKGIKIKPTPNYPLNSDVCIQLKWSYDRNMTLDSKATKILALVHSDLTGPIQPLAKDGFKNVLNFIDDYSGLTMLYFLKHKSNTLLATKKYLADITPYRQTTEWNSLLNLFNAYLYLIESNTSGQLLILCIKMGPLNGHGELYFL